MNTPAKTNTPQTPSALALMAARYSVDPGKLHATLQETVFKGATPEQCLALVVVANQYGLNPFTREIYAFPDKKGGGIIPVISVDGRINMMQNHPQFDGIEFEFHGDGDDLACTATIHRKDRKHPFSVTEYLAECRRETDPWRTAPRRMLRHKALIQACRVAFAFGGIGDEDDVMPMQEARVTEVATVPPVSEPAKKTETLSDVITGAGYTFDEFRTWAQETDALQNTDSLGDFNDIPSADLARLYRVRAAIIKGMAAIRENGGAK
jgi:phage recombination protein Bet